MTAMQHISVGCGLWLRVEKKAHRIYGGEQNVQKWAGGVDEYI
jgi:hypothetical protein